MAMKIRLARGGSKKPPFYRIVAADCILEEGIAQRASDIDVVYCHGYGFPRFRGGPMHAAEAMGLQSVVDRIEEFQETLNPDNWVLAPLLAQLAGEGGNFYDANI